MSVDSWGDVDLALRQEALARGGAPRPVRIARGKAAGLLVGLMSGMGLVEGCAAPASAQAPPGAPVIRAWYAQAVQPTRRAVRQPVRAERARACRELARAAAAWQAELARPATTQTADDSASLLPAALQELELAARAQDTAALRQAFAQFEAALR